VRKLAKILIKTREVDDVKGSIEMQICGALFATAIPKYCTNADASFTNPDKFSTSSWGLYFNFTPKVTTIH
jgi:hypothetical protein